MLKKDKHIAPASASQQPQRNLFFLPLTCFFLGVAYTASVLHLHPVSRNLAHNTLQLMSWDMEVWLLTSWDAFGLPENMPFAVREGLLSHCQQVLFQYLHSIYTHLFPLSPDYHLYKIVQPASGSVQCVRTVKLEGSHREWAYQWLWFSCLGQPTKPTS